MTWIESFPAKSAKAEYVFLADFEATPRNPKVKRALAALQRALEELTILGPIHMATCQRLKHSRARLAMGCFPVHFSFQFVSGHRIHVTGRVGE